MKEAPSAPRTETEAAQPNRVSLGGEVVAREPLRYSPAGVPILSLQLAHRSQQVEGGVPRQAEVEIEAVAVGELAVKLNGVECGQRLTATGFLTKRSRRSRRVVLHLNECEIE